MAFRLSIFCVMSLFAILSSPILKAVNPIWSIDFGSVFDNREGDDRMYEDKTFFFVTIAPELGLKFSDKDRIVGGAIWNQPLDNSVKDARILPTLYYRHESENWKFSMGMFPRTQLKEPLPGFLWCDSLAYFQRNIRGALVQYISETGFFDAYIDWRQLQSETQREAFNIVFHGEWQPAQKSIFIGSHLMMNHYAKTRHADASQSIVDNFLINPYIGINLSANTSLDSLIFKGGGLLTIERFREYGGWKTPGGFWLEATAEWKFLGLKNSLYIGGELYPLYSRFGTALYQGESYYQSNFYNRTDIYAKIIKNQNLELEAQLNFNVSPNNFMFYQRLLLNIHLGSQ